MATSGTFSAVWESGYWNSTSNTKWYHWQGKWSKSKTTITLSNQTLYMTFAHTNSYGNGVTDTVTTTGGSAQTVTWPDFSGSPSSTVSLADTSFTVSGSKTSSTISCLISGEITGSTTINYDAYYKAPTVPTISDMHWQLDFLEELVFDYGTTSFGVPESGTVYLYCDTSPTPTKQIKSKDTTGTGTCSTINIEGNTKYYARSRAKNNAGLWSDYSPTVSAITGPNSPESIEVTDITSTSVTAKVSLKAQGSDDAMTLVVEAGGMSTSVLVAAEEVVYVIINDLKPSTEYTISAHLFNSIGESDSVSATFTTLDDNKFYGSVDGKAKKIKKLYGSVDGKTKKIKKLYGSVDGKTKKVWEATE